MLIEKKKKGSRTKAADVCDLGGVVHVHLSRRTCVIRQLKLFFNVAAFEAEFEQNKFCKSSATFWIKEKKKRKKMCCGLFLCLKF